MTKQQVVDEVKAIRGNGGECTDPIFDNGYAYYVVQPGDVAGYVQEYDLASGCGRTRGNGTGCFWTDWKEVE